MKVLLVTGSRTVAGNPDASAIAAELLSLVILAGEYTSVVTGDAVGVDTLAVAAAERSKIPRVRYCLDRVVRIAWDELELERTDTMLWHGDGVPTDRAWPLVRNEVMVRDVKAMGELPMVDSVTCLGLVDPASKTGGTLQTLRLAKGVGIKCSVYTWVPARFVWKPSKF